MDQRHPIPARLTLTRFLRAVRLFATSEVGGRARWVFAALMLLLFAINGMNVVNSYVGRDFMTAIANRDQAGFVRQAILYLCVFAGATLIAVSSRFAEERLALLWRSFMTGRAVRLYLAEGTYHRLETARTLANPDQRIAEDIRAFTTTTLSFVLMLLNSSFTVIAFAGVLWSISPQLFLVAVLYAAGGSLLTILLGRPLIGLNDAQFDREANFRSELIQVRENAEAIRLAGAEPRLLGRLEARLAALIGNFRRITSVNRNLGFFTTGYNWLIQIIPALIVAPAFIAGQIEFGVITQSAMAFATLVAAFSLIVTQFQSISSFAAVVARLNALIEAIEGARHAPADAIVVRERPGCLGCEDLDLNAADDGRPLVRALSLELTPGASVLIRAENGGASQALFRALAGLDVDGRGILIRPAPGEAVFLAEQPYLPPGSLRAALMSAGQEGRMSDARLQALLADWGLEGLSARLGGLDAEQDDWSRLLSLGERQLLAGLRACLAAPRFAVLHRPATALGRERVGPMLARLAAAGSAIVHCGRSTDQPGPQDALLDIRADGGWTWTAAPTARRP